MKKLFIIILALTICLSSLASVVSAQTKKLENNEDKGYKITYIGMVKTSQHEIELMARESNETTECTFSYEGETEVVDIPVVRELILERTYNDGSVEQDYVARAYYEDTEESFDKTADNFTVPSGYYVNTTVHYTWRKTTSSPLARMNRVVTFINRGSSKVNVIYGQQEYFCSNTHTNKQTFYYTSQSAQAFNLQSTHSGFYESHNDMTAMYKGVSGNSQVYFSDGKSTNIDIVAYKSEF